MKRTIVTLAAAAALAVGLTACNTADATPVNTIGRTTAPLETTSAFSDDDLFLAVVRPEIPEAGAAHIAVGKAVCEALDDGATLDEVFIAMISAGDHFTPEQLGTLAGAGVGAYCPEHNDLIGGDPA